MTLFLILMMVVFLGVYTLVVLRQRDWMGVSMLAVVYALLITHTIYSSGMCRPSWLSFANKPLTVVSVMFQEPVAIYVWGMEEGNDQPSCLILPWNMQQAQKANELQLDGAPWELDADEEEPFHPLPVLPLSPKQVQ